MALAFVPSLRRMPTRPSPPPLLQRTGLLVSRQTPSGPGGHSPFDGPDSGQDSDAESRTDTSNSMTRSAVGSSHGFPLGG
jgi:hypothetical protein